MVLSGDTMPLSGGIVVGARPLEVAWTSRDLVKPTMPLATDPWYLLLLCCAPVGEKEGWTAIRMAWGADSSTHSPGGVFLEAGVQGGPSGLPS